MKISSLEISNFRNLKHVSIVFGHNITIFYGQNGSGKTSLLEAIHYLGLGRSFRTRNLNRIIHHDSDGFSIFSQLALCSGGTLPVGIERKKESLQCSIKIGGKIANSLVEIADILPLQLINADSHLLLGSGPLIRRQFLDWGVFHVKPSFYLYWQRASRLIKQRNAHLKVAQSCQELSHWDDELDQCARWLDAERQTYIAALTPLLLELLAVLLEGIDFNLSYYAGWNTQKAFQNILSDAFDRDKQIGYTQHGPHRADVQLKINNIAAADILSQGQQKLAAYALRLAQGKLLSIESDKRSIFLIDDLPSELDRDKRKLILEIIKDFDSQILITGIEAESFTDLFSLPETKMFHVEHGQVTSLK